MSRWTHVIATFRCDAVSSAECDGNEVIRSDGSRGTVMGELERVFGRQLLFPETGDLDVLDPRYMDACDEYDGLWAERDADPSAFLPCGGEGSLRIHACPDSRAEGPTDPLRRVLVVIDGDLRDFGGEADVESVRSWFMAACSRVKSLRQACCSVHDEWGGGDDPCWSYGPSYIWGDGE